MDTAPTEPSRITIRRAPGGCLTKSYGRDRKGKVTKRNYDNAKFFDTEVRDFDGVDGLAELLRDLQPRPDSCVIRAAPGRWHPGPGRQVRRRLYPKVEFADARGNFHPPARK